MDENELARRFDADRPRLRALAQRVLGTAGDADDAVQEAWLRLSRVDARPDATPIDNLSGWLTTVVSRVCLDMLRSRRARRELVPDDGLDQLPARDDDPESQAVLADAIGPALMLVLDRLAPTERLAFVLHDVFGVPFDEIGSIVGRSPDAARQLASRARRRVRGSAVPDDDLRRRREVVDAFLAASRAGDFTRLLELLDPEVVLSADATTVAFGALARTVGAQAVAERFSGHAKAARGALVDGDAGAAWFRGGEVQVVFGFVVTNGRIVAIDLIADPEVIARTSLDTAAR